MSTFGFFMKIDLIHEACYEGYCLSAASATRSEVKHTWQLLVCASTDHQRQGHSQEVQIWTVITSGEAVEPVMHGMKSTQRQKSSS